MPAVALAQTPATVRSEASPADPAPAEQDPPDLVILKSGGMLRGTISEMSPGERVVIRLVTGEVRSIEMDQVDYAGRAEDAPKRSAKKPKKRVSELERALSKGHYETEGRGSEQRRTSAPRVTATSQQKQVQFTSKEPGLHVHLLVGEGEATFTGTWQTVKVSAYRALCTTPCSAWLEPGSYRFGVSKNERKPAEAEGFINVAGGETVEVEHDSYLGVRIGGWVTMLGGGALGLALVLTARNDDCEPLESDCEPINSTQVIAGIGIAAVSSFAGYFMILKDDEASVGLGVAATSSSTGGAARTIDSLTWPGPSIAGSF